MEKHHVYVTVPKRKEWPSYWFLKKEFAPGSYALEVDSEQLEKLKNDPVIVLSFSPPAVMKVSPSVTTEHVEAVELSEETIVPKKLKVSKIVR